MRSMIETYPEADRYWVCTGSEAAYRGAMIRRARRFIRDYAACAPAAAAEAGGRHGYRSGRRRCWPTSSCSRIKARYPAAKLGAGLIFRGGQLRALDAVLPKDVWLMNMVNWDGETAMSDFDKIQGASWSCGPGSPTTEVS